MPKHTIKYESQQQNFRLQNLKLLYVFQVTKQIANLYVRGSLHCLCPTYVCLGYGHKDCGANVLQCTHCLVKENYVCLLVC